MAANKSNSFAPKFPAAETEAERPAAKAKPVAQPNNASVAGGPTG